MAKIKKPESIVSLQAQASRYWKGLAPRERLLLTVCAALLLVAGGYWLVLTPYLEARERLSREIPERQAMLEKMREDAQQVKVLQEENLCAVIAPDKLKPALEESLSRAGLSNSIEKLEAAGEGGVTLVATEMPFGQWIRWLERVAGEMCVSATAVNLTAEGEGVVRVEATLAPMSASK